MKKKMNITHKHTFSESDSNVHVGVNEARNIAEFSEGSDQESEDEFET